jgi:SPP1 family predicted phage head-tail adaptor
MFDPRKAKRQIVIKSRAAGEDAAGQPNGAWSTTVCTSWASFMAPSGRASAEHVAGGAEVSVRYCSWRIRYRATVTAGMRVEHTHDGTTDVWEIRQVLPDLERRKHVDLVCELGGVAT